MKSHSAAATLCSSPRCHSLLLLGYCEYFCLYSYLYLYFNVYFVLVLACLIQHSLVMFGYNEIQRDNCFSPKTSWAFFCSNIARVYKFCIIWKSCIIASCYHIISFLIYSICLYCWLLTKSSPPGNIFHKTHSLIVCDKMHTNFLEMLWNPLSRKPIIFHCRLTEFMIVSYKKWMSRFTWCLRQKHIQRGDFLYPTNRR